MNGARQRLREKELQEWEERQRAACLPERPERPVGHTATATATASPETRRSIGRTPRPEGRTAMAVPSSHVFICLPLFTPRGNPT